jgi:hypothetical protein
MNDDKDTQASGVCLFSNGAVYRVLYWDRWREAGSPQPLSRRPHDIAER